MLQDLREINSNIEDRHQTKSNIMYLKCLQYNFAYYDFVAITIFNYINTNGMLFLDKQG